MSEKLQNTAHTWVDPDDAPELTDEFFENGTWQLGDKLISRTEAQTMLAKRRGRPLGSVKADSKVAIKLRVDPQLLAQFKATGNGWQTRIHEAMQEWIKSHPAGQ